MNETLITDLVAQEALDQLDQLDRKMEGTLSQFQDCARELARGIKIPVEVTGDLDRLRELSNTTMQRAGQAAQQYTQQLQQQQQVIANTTNTISRQLMEQEKVNKAQREAYTQQQSALEIANRLLGTHEQNVQAMARYTRELEQLKAERKAGTVTTEEYIRRELELKTAKQEVQRILTNETKMNQAAAGSYQQLSLQLERMKQAQKQLNDEEKRGADGQALEKEIQALDAHLKDLAADMGEFQRNVGNYAIAGKGLRTELRELTMQMAEMLANGVDPTSEAFVSVAERAGELKDAMADAQSTIRDYANDTQTLTNTISVIETAASGYQTFQGALSAFGFESENAAKATQKLMGIMSMMNGIQKISTEITTNGTGAYRAYHAILRILGIEKAAVAAATKTESLAMEENAAATEANAVSHTELGVAEGTAAAATELTTVALETETVATTAATTAAIALKVALAALGIGAVIALIAALTEAVSAHNEEVEKEAELVKMSNDAIKDGEGRAASAAAELKYYTGVVNNFNGTIQEEKKLVDELNDKYGESLGYYQSVAQWKSALANMSEVYLDVLKWEAIAQAYLNKYAQAVTEGSADQYDLEAKFIEWKEMAAKQAKVLEKMVKLQGGGTKPSSSSGKTTRSSRSGTTKTTTAEDPKKAAEELKNQMEALINESNKMWESWETSASQKTIETYSEITSANKHAYEEQIDVVKAAYNLQETVIKQQRDAAIKAKQDEYEETIATAKKQGKDTTDLEKAKTTALTAVSSEYQEKILQNENGKNETLKKMHEDFVKFVSDETIKRYANEQLAADTEYIKEVTALKQKYAEELATVQHNEEKMAEVKAKYEDLIAEKTDKYGVATAQRQVDLLSELLKNEELNEEEREDIQDKLDKAKEDLAKKAADAEIEQIDRTVEADKRARDKRIKNIEEWMNRSTEAVQKIGEFIGAMYDGQISKIEQLLEAEQQRYDQEVNHIDWLAEHGAITTEEAEIRKRDAAERTAIEQERLEKKKAQIEYRKAIMEKANTIAQIGIATALGIMQALAMWPPNIPLSVFVGTMGAIQTATALAQPIKAYAEGTKGKKHPGGLALVGDGDKAELVLFDGKAWVTPDYPTVVDLPNGAEVLPDAEKVALMGAVSSIPRDKMTGSPVVINDYTALEGRVATNTKAVTRELRSFRRDMAHLLKRQEFNAYIASRI